MNPASCLPLAEFHATFRVCKGGCGGREHHFDLSWPRRKRALYLLPTGLATPGTLWENKGEERNALPGLTDT